MSIAEIERGMYRSLPENRELIVSRFDPDEVRGVPGFGSRSGRLCLTGRSGLIIPVVQSGLIVSLLIRPDAQERGKKYLVISSSWLDDGASPGMRIHAAYPSIIRDPGVCWIVEGPLKGNIVAERVGAGVFAVPGVNSWKEIKNMPLPRTVIIAFDSDYENFQVRYHARKLSNHLIRGGKEVYAALWRGHKGPDDALVGEAEIRFCRLFWRNLPEQV